jgi:hypothetical protein
VLIDDEAMRSSRGINDATSNHALHGPGGGYGCADGRGSQCWLCRRRHSHPNVAGKWEGTWKHRAGSGQITLQLTQEGSNVIGKQSIPGVIPLFGSRRGQQIALGQEVREGHLEDSTLIFYVRADVPRRRVNFTLTVIEETMTGTACGDTCATLKLKKAPF